VTPAGRGKRKSIENQTPAQRRVAMAGFCSCKTGIHAIHGNNLGATPQAGIQDRPLLRIPALAALVNPFTSHRDL